MARGIFGVDRVHVAPRLDDAIDQAATLAEEGGVFGEAIGSGARARDRLGRSRSARRGTCSRSRARPRE